MSAYKNNPRPISDLRPIILPPLIDPITRPNASLAMSLQNKIRGALKNGVPAHEVVSTLLFLACLVEGHGCISTYERNNQ